MSHTEDALADGASRLTRQHEIDIIKKLSHPNVVDLIAVVSSEGKDIFVMPLYERNLRQYVDKTVNVGNVDMDLTGSLCRQLIDAVQYLHEREQPIIHGDLKPENVMVETFRPPRDFKPER